MAKQDEPQIRPAAAPVEQRPDQPTGKSIIEQIRALGLSAVRTLWWPRGANVGTACRAGMLSHGLHATTSRLWLATAIGVCLFLLANVSLWAAIGDNLVSCWAMEEASGTRADSYTSSANDLTDNNTVAMNASGKVGNTAELELSNSEYLSRASNSSLVMGDIDFTIALWVNMESNATTQKIVAKDSGLSFANEYAIDLPIGGQFRFGIDSSSAFYFATPTGTASLATWYYIVGWHDATANTVNISVNDGTVFSTSTTGQAPVTGTTTFMVGRRDEAGSPFYTDGFVDEAAIWKRKLSGAEITDLYNSGTGRACSYIVPAASPTHPNRNFIGFTR